MKKSYYYIPLLCIVVFLSTSIQAQIRTFSGKEITAEVLDRFIQKQMDSLGMTGLSIALIDNDHIVYHGTFGVADINTNRLIDEASIFEAASLSKTAFAYFVMKMVEKRILNLDTPLYRYMPYPDITRDKRYQLITARMVLCHASGLPNWRYFEKPDTALHIKYPDLWLKFKPGTSFAYSGEGYHYLAQVIAYLNHCDLKTLDVVYQQDVCRPLGLEHFYFSGNDYIYQHKVSGHKGGKNVGRPWPVVFPTQDSTWFGSAGGLHTEAIDYARFLIALMNHKGISKASLQEMLKKQVEVPGDNQLNVVYGDKAWGLGMAILPTSFGAIYEHWGNNGGFQSGFKYLKVKKVGFVLFTNCDKGNIFDQNLSAFLME